ncbi:MAG: beta-lactamase family protein, partial [Actinomycetota bacterium]|nr:beta-lactamase family protein [Actinomycetota bacterium]
MDVSLLADAAHYLDQWLGYRQRTLRLPGLVAAVGHDATLLLHGAWGQADVERGQAMTPGLPFPVASHSKMFTAALVLRVVEQGRLRLDDPLRSWLPLTGPVGEATVGELLSHSAGVIRDGEDCDFWLLDRPFPSREELLAMAAPVLGRHERFKYSNVGFALLGEVVAAACGASYAEVARREVIEQLGLGGTHPDFGAGGCPVGY